MDMSKLELLYDHFKDSYELSKRAQEQRNKYYIILCILESLSFLMLLNTSEAITFIHEIINYKSEHPIQLGSSIIESLLWILIMYISIRYCQNTIYVERQYKYIHKLEEKIADELSIYSFNRESYNYLSYRPFVLKLIHFFYTWISPTIFIFINSVRIVLETTTLKWNVYLFLDIFVYLITTVLSITFVIFLNFKNEKTNKYFSP